MRHKVLQVGFLFLCVIVMASTARACLVRHPLNFADIANADVVIEAQVVDYTPDDWASISVITRRAIKGHAPARFSFGTAAPGYSFKVAPKLHLGERRIFALTRQPPRPGSKDSASKYFLISEPCAMTFAFPTYGDVARAIDLIFDDHGDPAIEAQAFAHFLGMTGRPNG